MPRVITFSVFRHGVVFTVHRIVSFVRTQELRKGTYLGCETWGVSEGMTTVFEDDQSRMVCEICHTMDIETNIPMSFLSSCVSS